MDEKPFTCPKCGYADLQFHTVFYGCGRPFMRDYADTRIHPRDPDLTGICTVKFWARILLVLTVGGIVLGLLASSGVF
jgi:hypothetical protein